MQEAKQVAVDVGKYLAFAGTTTFSWAELLERDKLRSYVAKLEDAGIGAEGICTKIERLSNAVTYACLEVPSLFSRKEEASFIKDSLSSWRNTFRREKPPLEAERGLRMAHDTVSLEDSKGILSNDPLKAAIMEDGERAKAGEVLRMFAYPSLNPKANCL